MRSSRLLALLMALQRTGTATAPQLAEELEVSVRTIYRDVAALQEAGVPLYTVPGAGGGVRLVDGWRSSIEGLTSDEVRALAVGGGPAADLGLGSVLAVARSKLRSGLPAPVRAELDLVAERFLLDASAWFRPEPTPPLLADLAEAVWRAARIDLGYQRGGRVRSRRVDPLGLVDKANVWYLVARHRGSIRTYRVSRIRSVRRRPESFERPAGFDLADYWHAAAAEFDADLRRVECELVVPSGSVGALRRAVPGDLTGTAVEAAVPGDDGRLRVSLRVESVEVAADQLVGVWGVEVVAPVELRARLAAHGHALATANHCG
ncbi:MAG: WYL domain-containing protein [Acidimicrobiia bacterium]|nr:WYL domain-containing protein [Acidimicrobiia bacterium]